MPARATPSSPAALTRTGAELDADLPRYQEQAHPVPAPGEGRVHRLALLGPAPRGCSPQRDSQPHGVDGRRVRRVRAGRVHPHVGQPGLPNKRLPDGARGTAPVHRRCGDPQAIPGSELASGVLMRVRDGFPPSETVVPAKAGTQRGGDLGWMKSFRLPYVASSDKLCKCLPSREWTVGRENRDHQSGLHRPRQDGRPHGPQHP